MSEGVVIQPGATLGVLGGGQLGRMFVHAAQRLGYFTAVLDPDPDSPAGRVSHHHIQADYQDPAALARLAGLCAAVTTEFENVPAAALQTLAQTLPVAPGPQSVAIAQDRAREKAHFQRCGVPCAPYVRIETLADVQAAPAHLLPGILKTSRLGYDGRGQRRVDRAVGLAAAWAALGQAPCVLEQRLPLAAECSVLVARSANGAMVNFPPQRNTHREGILTVTEVYPGNLEASLAHAVVQASRAIAEQLGYVGVLCVEFFVLADGHWVVNEMAPRPHNSGHYSLDACDLSQFEAQVRALTGLPLPEPRLHSPALMLNLLGDLWQAAPAPGQQATPPNWAALLALPGAHLHLYGKAEARPGRKMGHITLTGPSMEAVRQQAQRAAQQLGLVL